MAPTGVSLVMHWLTFQAHASLCKHAEHTSGPLVSIFVLEPSASLTSMDSVLFSSQFRAVKAKGLDVRAPTGQRSITLPESSLDMSFSTYVPISESRPLPVIPKSCTPEGEARSNSATSNTAVGMLCKLQTLPHAVCMPEHRHGASQQLTSYTAVERLAPLLGFPHAMCCCARR